MTTHSYNKDLQRIHEIIEQDGLTPAEALEFLEDGPALSNCEIYDRDAVDDAYDFYLNELNSLNAH